MSYAFRVGDQECTGDHLTPWQPAEAVSNARAEQGRYREGRESHRPLQSFRPLGILSERFVDGMPWFTTVLGFVLGLAGIVLVVVSFLSAADPMAMPRSDPHATDRIDCSSRVPPGTMVVAPDLSTSPFPFPVPPVPRSR